MVVLSGINIQILEFRINFRGAGWPLEETERVKNLSHPREGGRLELDGMLAVGNILWALLGEFWFDLLEDGVVSLVYLVKGHFVLADLVLEHADVVLEVHVHFHVAVVVALDLLVGLGAESLVIFDFGLDFFDHLIHHLHFFERVNLLHRKRKVTHAWSLV